jgi:lipopolysaccharide transport system ATP-binding protein
LTGRENVYVNGAILGMSKYEIDRELDSIIDFADIEEFIDSPVKHYSSGMYVRLGFAIAAHLRPDVLLIDEVLAVGDLSFQIKCLNYIQQLLASGTTIVFVSHNLYHVQRICSSAVLMEFGKASQKSDTVSITVAYEEKYGMVTSETCTPGATKSITFHSASIVSDNVDTTSGGVASAATDKPMRIDVCYSLNEPIQGGIQIGFLIKTAEGQRVFGGTTKRDGAVFTGEVGDYRLSLEFPTALLLQGNYQVSFSAFDSEYKRQLGAWERALWLRMTTPGYNGLHAIGCVQLPCRAYVQPWNYKSAISAGA